MNQRLFFSLLGCLFFASCPLVAKLSMPTLFGDNMVLQRNTSAAIYGNAEPDARVTVRVSWTKETFRTRADNSGKWRLDIPTGQAATGQTVEVKADETIRFSNVCLGEVWICSGQSNMARLLGGRAGGPIQNGFSIIKQANRPDIRLYTLPPVADKVPQADNPSSWLVSNHKTAAAFSAVGYIFGKELNDYLGVPIGLVLNAWGGSCVEAWISREKLQAMGKTEQNNYYLKESADISVNTRPQHEPSALFNGMLHPLIPYTIRGAIWYQGESNTANAHEYADLMSGMIIDWRERWGLGNFPFYFVQIAPYEYPPTRDNSALVREAQAQVQDRLFKTGMAVILDIGEKNDIHPRVKIPVGQRLAYLALSNTYGVQGFPECCPSYDSIFIEKNRIRVSFHHAGNGLYFDGDQVNELEIAGENRVFYPAQGSVTQNGELLVSSDQVAVPVAVRYGFKNWVRGNLFNTFGMPVSSFRTDDWEQ